jgi:hypothetical protein
VLQLEGCRDAALAVPGGSRREGSGMVEQQVPPSGKRTQVGNSSVRAMVLYLYLQHETWARMILALPWSMIHYPRLIVRLLEWAKGREIEAGRVWWQ